MAKTTRKNVDTSEIQEKESFKKEWISKDIILSEKQSKFSKEIKRNFITIGIGSPGTAKTFTTCYTALELLADKKIDTIVICKPVVESGVGMGFLPGTAQEKLAPYIESYMSTFQKMIGKEKLEVLVRKKIIQVRPLEYMLGSTYDNCIMILDEAQNTNAKQHLLFITRMGKESKVVIIGDTKQSYIGKGGHDLKKFADRVIKDTKGCGVFEFTKEDIVRHPVLIEIVDKYEQWELEKENKQING